MLEVVEYTDPACPWAWGSEPRLRWLRLRLAPLPHRWRRVFGILFDDDEEPAPDPAAEAAWYAGFIAEVAGHTGAPHAGGLSWLTRSSLPASLAAKAAEAQGPEVAERVLRRLRESTFLRGTPADDEAGVLAAVAGVPGLDTARLRADLVAAATREAVLADRAETRRPDPSVLALRAPGPHSGRAKEIDGGVRYALPTLVFSGPDGRVIVAGWRPLSDYVAAVRAVSGHVLDPTPPLTARDALRHFETLSLPELHLLTGGTEPPAGGVLTQTANGPLWTDGRTFQRPVQ
ncbi:DsbA family protein [Actinokineospora sp. NBRC 105648]|uniref:DsbA family protein n=1 Tax=Actinokineospora sp. NBRC 105648 TaxID=3032206 RepID=UPI0024A0C721|nr:DsbA family protein [Actinokineospora sp. NBRC 105648]GLZ39730.1 hypothetical protein Acsp05_33540 [Actinokineospora sp. NBRC 105648]